MKTIIGKAELVKQIAAKIGSVPNLYNIISAVFDVVEENLASGNEVAIRQFGTFKVIDCAERKGTNPRTGEEITISARKKPHFTPSKTFKEAVN